MSEILSQQMCNRNGIDSLNAWRFGATASSIDIDFPQAEVEGRASISGQQDLEIRYTILQITSAEPAAELLIRFSKLEEEHKITTSWGAFAWIGPVVELPTTISPFDLLYCSEHKKRNKLIEEVKALPRLYAERLYRRIKLLSEVAVDEYPNEEMLSANSLEGFLKFIKRQEPFKYPDTTMTPNGNLRIQWQQDENHHLAIEFISDIEAKIVIFAPDPVHPTKAARASFRLSIDSIINAIAPFGVLEWATE